MTVAVYNTIGKTYDKTRCADNQIVQRLLDELCPKTNSSYLDMGCGSGNYTGALSSQGVNIVGIDISEVMLTKARMKYPNVHFYQGDATALPFPECSFNGVISILAIHHIGNNLKMFQEAYRVIDQGKFIIFTSTPEQLKHYWLCHYFPLMMEEGIKLMTPFEELQNNLQLVGFRNIRQIPFFITNELQDWFLHAGKYQSEIYLDPKVRDGISTFQLFADPVKQANGLKQLTVDIASGEINKIINDYENTLGDYLFVIAEK